jgi:hypothetical protein
MSVALTLLGIEVGKNETRVKCRLTLSGAYATFVPGPPPSGGDTINFAPLVGQGAGGTPVFALNNPPIYGVIQGSTGDDYDFVPGPTLQTNLVVINTASNTQLGAGNYAARFTGDLYLYGEFVFQNEL